MKDTVTTIRSSFPVPVFGCPTIRKLNKPFTLTRSAANRKLPIAASLFRPLSAFPYLLRIYFRRPSAISNRWAAMVAAKLRSAGVALRRPRESVLFFLAGLLRSVLLSQPFLLHSEYSHSSFPKILHSRVPKTLWSLF